MFSNNPSRKRAYRYQDPMYTDSTETPMQESPHVSIQTQPAPEGKRVRFLLPPEALRKEEIENKKKTYRRGDDHTPNKRKRLVRPVSAKEIQRREKNKAILKKISQERRRKQLHEMGNSQWIKNYVPPGKAQNLLLALKPSSGYVIEPPQRDQLRTLEAWRRFKDQERRKRRQLQNMQTDMVASLLKMKTKNPGAPNKSEHKKDDKDLVILYNRLNALQTRPQKRSYDEILHKMQQKMSAQVRKRQIEKNENDPVRKSVAQTLSNLDIPRRAIPPDQLAIAQKRLLRRFGRLHGIPDDKKVNFQNIQKIVKKLGQRQLKKHTKRKKELDAQQKKPLTTFHDLDMWVLQNRMKKLAGNSKLQKYIEAQLSERIKEKVSAAKQRIDKLDDPRRANKRKRLHEQEAKARKQAEQDLPDILSSAMLKLEQDQLEKALPHAPRKKIHFGEREVVPPPHKKNKKHAKKREKSHREQLSDISWGSLQDQS